MALVVALGALTVAVWWVWLGLDTEREFDQATQTTSGPYEAPRTAADCGSWARRC